MVLKFQSEGDIEWEVKIQKNRHLLYRIKDKETGIWSLLHSDFKIKQNGIILLLLKVILIKHYI